MLPITTFRRLFAEHFPEQPESAIFVPVDEREAWLKKLAKKLEQKRRVSCFISRRQKQVPESVYLGIQIADAGEDSNSGDYLNLQFENRKETYGLWLVERGGRQKTTVRPDGAVIDIGQVERLLDVVLEEQERRNLKHKRRDKMEGLKQTSLTGRLRKLGKEHNFAFAIGESKRNVNLSLRVNGRMAGFHFTFPKGRLDKVLETLPDLIAMLERMQKLGIAFHRQTSGGNKRSARGSNRPRKRTQRRPGQAKRSSGNRTPNGCRSCGASLLDPAYTDKTEGQACPQSESTLQNSRKSSGSRPPIRT